MLGAIQHMMYRQNEERYMYIHTCVTGLLSFEKKVTFMYTCTFLHTCIYPEKVFPSVCKRDGYYVDIIHTLYISSLVRHTKSICTWKIRA